MHRGTDSVCAHTLRSLTDVRVYMSSRPRAAWAFSVRGFVLEEEVLLLSTRCRSVSRELISMGLFFFVFFSVIAFFGCLVFLVVARYIQSYPS